MARTRALAGRRGHGLARLGPALLFLIVPLAAGWMCWQLLEVTVKAVRVLAACLGLALPPLTVGRHRRAAAPLWVCLAGLITLPVPGASWIWVLTGAALMLLADRRERRDDPAPDVAGQAPDEVEGRRYLSAREIRIAARVFAGIAAAGGLGAPWWAELGGVSAAVLVGGLAWWRDVTEPAVQLSRFEQNWYERVAHPDPQVPSRFPDLEGWFREWDDQAGRGVYELAHADAWDVAGMDAKVELAFDQPPGTVSLSADPRLSRRLLRITASEPGIGGRLRLFDGYSLGRDGRFVVGYTKGGVPVCGRLWNTGGALYITIIAPPNMGKGSLLRLIAVEAAACPDLLLLGADGKRGGGIGYLQAAFHTLSTDHDASVDLIHGYLLAVRERAERYGGAGEDGYYVRAGDPRMLLLVDEPQWIMRHDGRVARWLEEISGISRFVGAGVAMSVHKGDGPGYGSTMTRSNMITNGWRAVGPAPDAQAKSTAVQTDDFDPATLPDQPGWFGLVGRVLDGLPTPVRALWLPNDLDVRRALADDITGLKTELDIAPHGTVQQWLARDAVHPDLHPDTLAALQTPARARAAAPAADPTPAGGWTRIEATLRAHPDGLLRFQIAEAAGLSAGHTSQLLKERRESVGDVIQGTNRTWRLAA